VIGPVVYDRFGVQVRHGDCLAVMRTMAPESVDAVVTDPPAGIGFMGKSWDSNRGGRDRWIEWLAERMQEALRVLKPGGHALVWALPRTSHWTAMALEDAGFEVRDCITHLFGSGFPKSRDISKDIDRIAGVDREAIGVVASPAGNGKAGTVALGEAWQEVPSLTAPTTDAARQWAGWGTALKPASEHWWLVRKPLGGTVAGNVLEHGTGALNIAGCVVPTSDSLNGGAYSGITRRRGEYTSTDARPDAVPLSRLDRGIGEYQQPDGRWPPNAVLSHGALLDPDTGEVVGDACADGCVVGCAAAELDAQSGNRPAGGALNGTEPSRPAKDVYGAMTHARVWQPYGDSGGASRFFPVFRWEAKAPPAERPRVNGTAHPTVKSVALMRWMVRLITPPGGLVLDCFAGTGPTGQAARAEGMRAVLIEADPLSLPFIRARLDAEPKTEAPPGDALVAQVVEGPRNLFDLLGDAL
jgi:hypothetical protein